MRHPNNGQSEGDLSRLTGTSSTSSTPSSSNDNLDIENNENNLCNDNCAIISSQALILSVNNNENANNLRNSQHLHGHLHHHHHHHHGHHHHHHHHHSHQQQQQQQQKGQHQQHYPSYLPEYIDPLEWQKSRKRKERLDSTSSITQVDRKLQRSNSEELITSSDCEVIRRVSSHEDFKKQPQPLQEKNTNIECSEDTNNLKTISENDNNSVKSVKSHKSGDNQQQQQQQSQNESTTTTNNFIIRLRLDTSPARSNNHRWSPNRFDDSSENENERRRSSERFSKTRAPPGRKSGVVKKVGSNSGSGGKYSRRSGDENGYKYDISHLKYERRGFVSKLKLDEQRKDEAATDGESIIHQSSSSTIQPSSASQKTNDYNDNNLIDLSLQQQKQQQQPQLQQSQQQQQQQQQQQKNNNGGKSNQQQQQQPQQQQNPNHNNQDASIAIPLPWDRSPQDIQTTPVLCRRFATFNEDSIDSSSYNSSQKSTSSINNNNHLQQYNNYYSSNNSNNFTSDSSLSAIKLSSSNTAIIAAPAVIVDNEPIKSFRTFTKMENLKTREALQNVLPLGLLQTPEERLKTINKKLNALKKKVTLLEENYEKTYGYRPSQIERYNDKQIKTALAEINKLRKEKQEIKADPMAAFGYKVSGGLDAEQKLNKIKDTLADIQNKLNDRRVESSRPENLENLTSDQLVQEKTAVQHSLLHFESLYGRPSTRDERDAARPLYDRYRILKRMITRSISIPATGGVSELPTILEHEAMTYETIQQQLSISTDTTTNSLTDHVTNSGSSVTTSTLSTNESPTDNSSGGGQSMTCYDSTTDSSSNATTTQQQLSQDQQQSSNTGQQQQQQQQQVSSVNDVNLHMLSLDELWQHLERVREEKKDLKKSIKDFENLFEEQNGRKMLKNDRKLIEDTYAAYKENKAKVRLLQALIKKHMTKY